MTKGAQKPCALRRVPSTSAWLAVHVGLPLVPYLTACLVRSATYRCLCWSVFDVKELALSLSLASLYVRQSLLAKEILLPSPDRCDDVAGAAAGCLVPTALLFGFFVVIEAFSGMLAQRHIENVQRSLVVIQILTIIFSILFLCLFIRLQRSFKLRAR